MLHRDFRKKPSQPIQSALSMIHKNGNYLCYNIMLNIFDLARDLFSRVIPLGRITR
jgi:hypothetical protein